MCWLSGGCQPPNDVATYSVEAINCVMTTDRKVVSYKPLTLVRGSWL